MGQLLTGEEQYLRRWRAQVVRAAESHPHQSAVARVLAHHLWDTGEIDEADRELPRRLKDVVARALAGRGVSHQSLAWFIRAFEMSPTHERALWASLQADLDDEAGGAVLQVRTVPAQPAVPPLEAEVRAAYRTQSLIETFTVGPDRCRRAHQVVHVLEALQDLDRVTYRFDTSDLAVSVTRGGAAGRLTADPSEGMRRLDIRLSEPLRPGQATAVETAVTYPAGGTAVTGFHRSLRATAGGVSLQVRFDPTALPARVWWASRGGRFGERLVTRRVELGQDHSVHWFLTPDEDCLVGFRWDW